METMGLLVIVIIVSIIIFLIVAFSVNNKGNSGGGGIKQEFKDSQAIANFGTTTLEVTVPHCNSRTIRELFIDCAFLSEIRCGEDNSCKTANDTMKLLLEQTLDEWGYEYVLTITSSNGKTLSNFVNGCNSPGDSRRNSTEVTPFGSSYGSSSFNLKICR